MAEFDSGRTYFDLQITAESPTTEIWLGDDEGQAGPSCERPVPQIQDEG